MCVLDTLNRHGIYGVMTRSWWARWQQRGWFVLAVSTGMIGALGAGCGGDGGYFGPSVRLTGSFNGWLRGELAPELTWDGQDYRGTVTLPGETLELQVYVPTLLSSFGSARLDRVSGVPALQDVASEDGSGTGMHGPLRFAMPISAHYEVVFSPQKHTLHIDFAEDAKSDQSPEAALLIEALDVYKRQNVPFSQVRIRYAALSGFISYESSMVA